ncbi:unnamed protein product [Rotaria sp. Silwood2]|nr:unnamed protein product [Rotaria sp. Silwood2]CAF4283317.1 unnamed protein product [Rotaria sp. Silwood2]
MNILLLLFLFSLTSTNASHFNGGTITWAPINPSDNSSIVNITVTQLYSWTYPTVTCTTDVPITTSTYSNWNTNLTCVSNCATDGDYSLAPVNILTDCISYSTSLGMMLSERSVNITLNTSAYFYISYTGSAWRKLNDPPESNLAWSILSLIDLRMRDDGILNTPPVASVISPQYVIVNTTTQINIPVSDVNTGDDIRCRWSVYQPGYRKRRQIDENSLMNSEFPDQINQSLTTDRNIPYIRKKRQECSSCNSGACSHNCLCSCPACDDTTCTGTRCSTSPFCPAVTTTTRTTLSTSSFLHPPIDECGSICYPSGLPNDTTLSNCTISFTDLIPDTWYAISIQVEDFINDTSTIPMSSVPVQFLIYVLSTPTCLILPLILPLTSCSEVEIGVTINITLYAMNLCGSTVSITDIIVSKRISGMTAGNLINSTKNSSLVYVTFTWTPQSSQIGQQELCIIAFNNLFVQSISYCVMFTVTSSTSNCPITTSKAARSRRQIQHKDDVQWQRYFSLNQFIRSRNNPFTTPKKRYAVHNIDNNQNGTNTVQSSIQTAISSRKARLFSMSHKNNKVSTFETMNSIDHSLKDDKLWQKPTLHQSIDNISFSLPSAIQTDEISNVEGKGVEYNSKSRQSSENISSSPITHVTKLSRKHQAVKCDITKKDNNDNRNSSNINFIQDNVNDDITFASSKIAIDNNEKSNAVQSNENATTTVHKPKVVKIKPNEFSAQQHNDPINTNFNSQDVINEDPQRTSCVRVTKLKQSPSRTSKLQDFEKPAVSESNQAIVTSVGQQHSKVRSHPVRHRKNVVGIMKMS